MSGKRFEWNRIVKKGTVSFWDNEKEVILNASHSLDLLNDLNNENEQLKQSYKEFEDECQSTFNAMSRKQNDLYRKNFKLKEENEQLKEDIGLLKYQNELLSDELEQAKAVINKKWSEYLKKKELEE